LNQRLSRFLKTLGPGVLFASTAIGVSHLVQSTRAGAEFGFLLLGVVIAVNLLKYPFFEYASRYASATGTSVIDGYEKLGRKYLLIYFLITISSMFFVTAAVGFVTAGFLTNLFGIDFLGTWTILILFGLSVGILCLGKYSALDGLIKIIAIVLMISTTVAFVFALASGPVNNPQNIPLSAIFNESGIFFLIALMGWMPTAVDLSSWNSLWTVERIKQTKFKPKLSETLFEFNLGYLVTAILAIFFLVLGAFIFFGTGEELPNNNALFANKVVTIYTQTIGEWSYFVIAAAAFSAMLGTTIAVFDGYSRSIQRTTTLLFQNRGRFATSYAVLIFILAAGALFVVFQFGDKLKELVDFATTISFLIAPVIAIFNLKIIKKHLTKDSQPPLWLLVLSYAGIVFLTGFAIFYLLVRFSIISF
jgi:Mn2+/Fe2+ NRAMP family transporter